MNEFVQLTVTGVANGAIFALAALGFVLIYKSTEVLNFAQGDFLRVGAFVAYAMIVQLGLWWPVGIALTLVVAVALGAAVERVVLRPMVGEPTISVIMVTIGLSSVLKALVGLTWGSRPRAFPSFIPTHTVSIADAEVGVDRLWAIGIAALLLVGFSWFFRSTRRGVAMRAVADDPQAAMSMGIRVPRVYALAWSIAAASAVVAGALLANIIGVGHELGTFGLIVFPVVILGGLDSILGAVVAGVVIGLLRSYAGWFGHGLNEVVPFAVLVLVLMIRPYGLFGQRIVERV